MRRDVMITADSFLVFIRSFTGFPDLLSRILAVLAIHTDDLIMMPGQY
jgi:hypothetical protein